MARILSEEEKQNAAFAGIDLTPDFVGIENYFNSQLLAYLRAYGQDESLAEDPAFRSYFAIKLDPTHPEYKFAGAALARIIEQRNGLGGAGGGGPSTAQQAAGIQAEITNLAKMFGVEGDWGSLAWTAAENNWNAAMIKDHLADLLSKEMINREGIVASVASQVREVASQYYVSVSDDEIFDWAKRYASDEIDKDIITQQIKNRAKVRFSHLSDVIDSGTSVAEYFRPHREVIAQLMDLSPQQVDLMNDSRWIPVMDNLPGQERRAMTIQETGQYVRSLEDWKKTSSATDFASQMGNTIGKIMGGL